MAKREIKTDFWVYELLKEVGLEGKLEAQGSSIKEINKALKTASKKGTGKVGFPEFVGVVKDFLLVIEDKADISNHIKLDDKGLICNETSCITNYAVNGAYFYGKHLINNTSYKKVIAFGISGNEKHHRITPIWINEREYCKILPEVESFYNFNENNIDEFYIKEILKEDTSSEKETKELLQFAKQLHEDLRNYGNLQDTQKPLVVSGILLALREIERKSFSLDSLNGDSVETDGEKIFNAIDKNLQRSNVQPSVKKSKLLNQFTLIKDTKILNEYNKTLGKTPLKYYAEQINEHIFKHQKFIHTSEDFLGRFYGEFMSYSGGNGQSLGIVLTPKHITELFCDLADLKPTDTVFDPCCGTAGFLIAAMHYMLGKAKDSHTKNNIRKNQLHGIELQPYMFTIATTNMILRGDGKSNLIDEDFLKCNTNELQLKGATVGMINPPYSQGSKQNPALYEISFVEHLLNSVVEGGKIIAIVPQSSMTGKTKDEQNYKANILKHHTLEGVITLSKDTFYGIGVNPCIAVFTAHKPHPKDKICKFIDFKDDGYKVAPHIGLLGTESAKDKKQHLLDVWRGKIESSTKFCVESTIDVTDEWLHSFYYFNDEIPREEDFDKTITDYLSFEFSMIAQGRRYLFENNKSILNKIKFLQTKMKLKNKWKEFKLSFLFKNYHGKRLTKENRQIGSLPLLTASENNQGISSFIYSDSMKKFKDCITIDMFGHAFYHDYLCSGDDNIYFFINDEISKFAKIFIITCINQNSNKYSYGKQFRQGNADRDLVLLPINSQGKPDYEFMHNYMLYLEQKKILAYIKYIQQKHDFGKQ